jgi:hypothetical protein
VNLCGLAAKVAQVVELGSADITASKQLDFLNDWSVQWESALNPNSVRNLANRESLTNT